MSGVQHRERKSIGLLSFLVHHCSTLSPRLLSCCKTLAVNLILWRDASTDRLQSIFGISTFTGSPLLYLWLSIPLLAISLVFTVFFPWAVRRFQKMYYPLSREHVKLPRNNFTLLGDELPDSADVPRTIHINDPNMAHKHVPRQEKRRDKPRSRSKIRSLSRRGRRRGVEDKV